ncbi:nucleotide-sugar transporter-domain-containing protein, partial [Kalaharituber pfeilii]
MHYSRIMPVTGSGRYLTSTAVFLNEIIKLIISVLVALRDRRRLNGSLSSLTTNFRALWVDVFRSDSWKLAIPAALYTFQNNLQYIAVSNLDAATFQVTYQLKIITTALFSVTMLHRKLSINQWISLFLLTAGIAIVQIPPPENKPELPSHQDDGAHRRLLFGRDSAEHVEMDRTVGLTAVVVGCTLSGLAGVYFEKVLKGSSTSLWVRNIQLSFYSLFPALFIGVMLKDGKEIMERGFFDGYNAVVWTAIGFQAAGGIIVALCVNYADNIAKNFATSISILLSSLASIHFFNFKLSLFFVVGASIVLCATWLYSKPQASQKADAIYIPLTSTNGDEGNDDDDRSTIIGSSDGDLGVRSSMPSGSEV